jgi:hypothetical protein
MVSRKKKQGKARKAAKAREEAEQRRSNNNQTTNGPQQHSLAAQMQQLQIGDAPIARRDMIKCRHGYKQSDICRDFMKAFMDAFDAF